MAVPIKYILDFVPCTTNSNRLSKNVSSPSSVFLKLVRFHSCIIVETLLDSLCFMYYKLESCFLIDDLISSLRYLIQRYLETSTVPVITLRNWEDRSELLLPENYSCNECRGDLGPFHMELRGSTVLNSSAIHSKHLR
jgi:hypothetical protein